MSAEEHMALLQLAHACLDPAKTKSTTAFGLPSGTFEKRRLEQRANGTWSEIAPLKPTQALSLAERHHHLTGSSNGVSFLSASVGRADERGVHGWNF